MREATLYVLVSFLWGSEGMAVLSAMGAIGGTVYTVFGSPYKVGNGSNDDGLTHDGGLVLAKFLAKMNPDNPMSVFVFNYCVARLPKGAQRDEFTSTQMERLYKDAQKDWYERAARGGQPREPAADGPSA